MSIRLSSLQFTQNNILQGVQTLSSVNTTGNITVSTDKFIVTALTGNTQTAGTLSVGGATTLNNILTVSGIVYANGGINIDSGKFTVDGANTGNITTAGNIRSSESILVGATGISGAGSYSKWDNQYYEGVSVLYPGSNFPNVIEFAYSLSLSAGVTKTIFTLSYTSNTTAEDAFYLFNECLINANETSNSSCKFYQSRFLFIRANTTNGVFNTSEITPTSAILNTNLSSFSLGSTTWSIGTRTPGGTEIQLNQAMLSGTASQFFGVRGNVRIIPIARLGGSGFITGITIG